MKIYQMAEQYIRYQFLYPETAEYFTRYESAPPAHGEPVLTVTTTLEYMEQYAQRAGQTIQNYPGTEYDVLALATSAALLHYRAVLFHSVGFSYRGKAIVFTGPSGIGKTTQYAQWKRCFGDRVKVISGDMSALALHEDGNIWVHPSAWNGKEHLRHEHSDPLGGIVILEQAPENSIVRLEAKDAILPVYNQMCVDRREKEQIRLALELEDILLRKIPVWKLSSRGDLASARLCHDTITGEIYGE